jgi:hypothetical protein
MITIPWRPARFALDAVLVLLGLVFGVVAAARSMEALRDAKSDLSSMDCFGPLAHELLAILTACLYLG